MVGALKHLHDLSRMKADVRVICRQCGFEVDWTVGELSRYLIDIGGNLAWSEVTGLLTCRRQGCGSTSLRATAVPYTRRQANLPRQIGKLDARIIATALEVLTEAVDRPLDRRATAVDVRLALLILYLYLRDRTAVTAFWERAAGGAGAVHETMREPLNMIRHALIQRGLLAAEPVAERIPTWPWSSPAPPGWKVRSGGKRGPSDGEPLA